MIFNTDINSYNDHHDHDIDDFYYPLQTPSCYCFDVTPFPHLNHWAVLPHYRFVFMRQSCKWSHIVCDLWSLASFMQHNVNLWGSPKLLPRAIAAPSSSLSSIPLHGWVVGRRMVFKRFPHPESKNLWICYLTWQEGLLIKGTLPTSNFLMHAFPNV